MRYLLRCLFFGAKKETFRYRSTLGKYSSFVSVENHDTHEFLKQNVEIEGTMACDSYTKTRQKMISSPQLTALTQ